MKISYWISLLTSACYCSALPNIRQQEPLQDSAPVILNEQAPENVLERQKIDQSLIKLNKKLPPGASLNINIQQPLFDGLKPVFNSLLVRNLNQLRLPDLDIVLPVPDVANIDFHVKNMACVNATIKPASGVKIVNDAVRLNFVGVGAGMAGEYDFTLSKYISIV
jgi:hypothetical protein